MELFRRLIFASILIIDLLVITDQHPSSSSSASSSASRSSRVSSRKSSQSSSRGRGKLWKFVFSLDGEPANFLNEDGELVGQSVSMVRQVCARANKKCELTFTEDRSRCWNSATNRSEILDNGEAQICANLVESPTRNQFYTFPEPSIYRLPTSQLYRKIGNSDVTLEKLKECNDLTMGFPTNTALGRECLLSAGFFVKEENAIGVSTTTSITAGQTDIVDKIVNDEVDFGIFVPRLMRDEDKARVEVFGDVPCGDILIGLNMMVKQPQRPNDDAQKFLDWWGPTLKAFICDEPHPACIPAPRCKKADVDISLTYAEFCAEMEVEFIADPLCFDSPSQGKDRICGNGGTTTAPPDATLPTCP